MRLKGKKAVITGAGAGLGKCMALEMAREGADVAVWDIHREPVLRTQTEVEALGRKSVSVVADVADGIAVAQAVKTIADSFQDIDILVNNAGICLTGSIEEITEEQWDKVLGVNLKGTFLVSRAVMPFMKKKKAGAIINLGSVSGKVGGIVAGSHYSASKAAVMCFTKSLARELGPYGINVNGIAPGVVETDMSLGLSKGKWDDYLAGIPLGRIGQAEDVARVAVFLASPDAGYLTGEIIDVNGGQFMD